MATSRSLNAPTRDAILQAAGLSKGLLWMLGGIALLASGTAAVTATTAVRSIADAERRVQRYVVFVNDKADMIAQWKLGDIEAPLPNQVYEEFLAKWVSNVYARSSDVVVTTNNLREAAKVADDRMASSIIRPVFEEATKDQGRNPIDITDRSAHVTHRDGHSAELRVYWKQKFRSSSKPPTTWSAIAKLVYIPITDTTTAKRTLFGMFVRDFSIPTQER